MKRQKNTTLKAAIAASGKTQARVARDAGIPPSYLSQIINRHRNPLKIEVERLCAILGASARKLELT